MSYENGGSVTLVDTFTQPAICQTSTYLAGANEVAAVSMDVTVMPNDFTNLYLAPMVSKNGGGAAFAVNLFSVESISAGGWTTLHNQTVMTLTQGATYRFMTGVRVDNLTSVPQFTCRGMVTIYKS